ncbi:Gfo/Idh/MocA family protein [Enterococcus timonensis]|uniref:Gfo/Idh/MocA family protein n=1 Tax=Enterococcus timonensis TaxID=1852364 RepID=UPI0008DAB9D3|nr:Gfo/Idh/MocA family oxidoreductase [Enterococcus timonensis]
MIKFGIIGCGSISGIHAAAIQKIEGAKITACCDINIEKGLIFASRNQCQYYYDYQELLASDVDIVTIATPHFLHKEMVLAALQAEKHVICEKPMAVTIEEANEIIKATADSDCLYAVCFQNRFNPSFIELKHLIDGEQLGHLKGLKCELTWKRNKEYYQSAKWKGSWEKEGGGVLINQAIHTLDAISWLIEQPTRVKGKIMTSLLEDVIEVEDAAMATAQMADGVPVVIFASNDYSSDPTPLMTFDFEEGLVELTMNDLRIDGNLIKSSGNSQEEGKKDVWGDGHQRFYRAFVNQLKGIEDPLIPLLAHADAKNALELLTRIYQSNATNKWELVSEI